MLYSRIHVGEHILKTYLHRKNLFRCIYYKLNLKLTFFTPKNLYLHFSRQIIFVLLPKKFLRLLLIYVKTYKICLICNNLVVKFLHMSFKFTY